MTLFRGDDTNAFGNVFLSIRLKTELIATISKAIFQCGPIHKEFINPQFPLIVNLSAEETVQLQQYNECYLKVFDENGYAQTCEGTIKFLTQEQKVF